MAEKELGLPKQRSGVSLIASLIVIVLIVIALVPLLRALSSSLFVSADTESTIVASNLMQAKMEEIRTSNFPDVISESKAQISKYPRFQREVVVTSPQPDLKEIKVTIYWESSGGNEQNISIETYAANY